MGIMIDTPFRVDGLGGITTTTSRARQVAIRLGQLIATANYERPMRALYGSNASGLVFGPIGEGLAAQLQVDLEAAINRFDPDIDLVGITVVQPPGAGENDSTIALRVGFRVPVTAEVAMFTATITVAGEVIEVTRL